MMKPGWSLRSAELAVRIFEEWSPEVDVEDFAASAFGPTHSEEEIAVAISIFDDFDTIAEARDLVDMLKSQRHH